MRDASPAHSASLLTAVLLPALLLALVTAYAPATFSAPTPSASAARQNADSDGRTQSASLPRGRKLILTDGSYQLIREYERNGDRVRYYSVERSAWEEIPASLVDWTATEKANAEDDAAEKALQKKLADADRAARLAGIDSDRSFEAQPGLILPDSVGLYAIENHQLQALQQDLAVSRVDKLRAAERIASGVPLIKTRATLEIHPKHARVRLPGGEVEFYFRTADGREPRLQLLHAEVGMDRRKLDTLSTDMAGQNSYKGNEIPLMSSEAARGLYRFTLDQRLMPGEYALVELTTEGDVDLYVWDFGVDVPPHASAALP